MAHENMSIPDMSLEQLFSTARAAGDTPEVKSLTIDFHLIGCDAEAGTLTITRNPASTRWLTTVGIAQGDQYYSRIAQGQTAHEALAKIERYCHWWLRL